MKKDKKPIFTVLHSDRWMTFYPKKDQESMAFGVYKDGQEFNDSEYVFDFRPISDDFIDGIVNYLTYMDCYYATSVKLFNTFLNKYKDYLI